MATDRRRFLGRTTLGIASALLAGRPRALAASADNPWLRHLPLDD